MMLQKAIKEERFKDAAFVRDHASAGLVSCYNHSIVDFENYMHSFSVLFHIWFTLCCSYAISGRVVGWIFR